MKKDFILDCISKADREPAAINNPELSGFSGGRIIALLKYFAKEIVNNETTYLEVGVFQGLTLLSVAGSVPGYEVFGIDNFAFFDREGKNLDIIKDRMNKLGTHNARIINRDFEDALKNLDSFTGSKKIGLFFIDGPHDYRSQLMCLLLIKPWLSEDAVIIVDDSNYLHVRQANRDFLETNHEFRLLFQTYTKAHPSNLAGNDRKEVEKGWWNGINVIVRDKENIFEPFFPPVIKEKRLFTNDHLIHTSRYPEAYRKYSFIIDFLESLKGKINDKTGIKGKFRSLNTYSGDLTCISYNPSLSKSSDLKFNETGEQTGMKIT